jgi:hypothetical protein
MIQLYQGVPGYLVLDDTTNPKYGLQHFTRKVKLFTTGGFLPLRTKFYCYGTSVSG